MPECVDIFKNRKSGKYLLQKTCPDPILKGPVSFGEPETLTEQELRRSGIPRILEALSFSSSPCSDPALIRRPTEEEYAGFRRQHECVSVTRWPEGEGGVEIRSLRRVRGGYRSIAGAKTVISPNDIQEQLIDALLEAFQEIEEQD